MALISLHDRTEIERFLRRNVYLHIYALGDLDDFFWPGTSWYAQENNGKIEAVLLLYHAPETPTLMALSEPPYEPLRQLLHLAAKLLPVRLSAHLTPECRSALEPTYDFASRGLHYKMALRRTDKLRSIDTSAVVRLGSADVEAMRALYAVSYPYAWFDPRLVAAGSFWGVRQEGALVGVGGVHVLAPSLRIAAIGSIAVHPECRGRGLATRLTARLCSELLSHADALGLNVKADNLPAVSCYERLGFERVASYEEGILQLASSRQDTFAPR
jgi:ribosomal protein S18 acetylase RimI-like enzyme